MDLLWFLDLQTPTPVVVPSPLAGEGCAEIKQML
jgi:hypothetical protein